MNGAIDAASSSEPSGQNIPKNHCRTTIAERMIETLAELPFIGDQVVCLSHDQGRAGLPTTRQRRFVLGSSFGAAHRLSLSATQCAFVTVQPGVSCVCVILAGRLEETGHAIDTERW